MSWQRVKIENNSCKSIAQDATALQPNVLLNGVYSLLVINICLTSLPPPLQRSMSRCVKIILYFHPSNRGVVDCSNLRNAGFIPLGHENVFVIYCVILK